MAVGLRLRLTFALMWSAAVGSAAVPTAQAQQTECEQAAVLRERGIQRFDERRFGEAADAFRQSLSLCPSPSVAFNLAQCLRASGRPLEAVRLYQQVLEGQLGPLPPERAAQVREQLEAAQDESATLTLRVRGPARAEVRVDGADPFEVAADGPGVERRIDPGAHHVTATAPQFDTTEHHVVVETGGHADVELVMAPSRAPGRLIVVAPRPDDLLVVPGIGRAHGRLDAEAAPGRYTIRLEGPEGPREDSADVLSGETRRLVFERVDSAFPWLEVLAVGGTVVLLGGALAVVLGVTFGTPGEVEGAEPWGVLTSLAERP